jgi:hypothetical protein
MARGLIATWRRLFIARPSPTLERLLGWLAATPYAWQLTADGKLRAREPGAEMCPVTGVVRHRTRALYGIGDWVRAADAIGLSYADACLVVQAADLVRPPSQLVRRLRRRLLLATGVETPTSAPAGRDAMDVALARLVAGHVDPVGAAARRDDELVAAATR